MLNADVNLFAGTCPFRAIPATAMDLSRLRQQAGMARAVATGFDSLFHYDPGAGLARDLDAFRDLRDWLRFYAVINPEFPQLREQIEAASQNPQICGLRLFPTLHHYRLDSPRIAEMLALAAEAGLPVNLTARLLDGRVAPRYLRQAQIKPADVAAFLKGNGAGAKVILSMFFFGELQGMKLDWRDHQNVFLDIGCCKPNVNSFDEIPNWAVPERLLFGSGAPLYYWKGSRLAVENARLTTAQKTAILGGNAKELFGWD